MTGAQRIAQERERQKSKEGWSPEHDDSHKGSEMAKAAGCYAFMGCRDSEDQHVSRFTSLYRGTLTMKDPWPWSEAWDKRHQHRHGYMRTVPANIGEIRDDDVRGRIRCLEIAGALCAAEIDRLQRAVDGDVLTV